MNKLLMIALDFPPCKSAGVQRTQKFIEYLPGHNWQPAILTAMPMIYDELSYVPLPQSIKVYRAFGLDTFKHLSYRGKHFQFMAKPDRFFSWYWHGVMKGMQAIRETKPDVIWSTFPCSTAHRIAATLHRKTGLPWVADFRDPFAGTNPLMKADNKPGAMIDKEVVEKADLLIFSAQNTLNVYRDFYPHVDASRFHLITNGFNEEEFVAAENRIKNQTKESSFSLLHSGALYPKGRDPLPLIKALHTLRVADRIPQDFRIVLRGCEATSEIADYVTRNRLEDVVLFKQSVPYTKSIDEMLTTDALFLLQGSIFNNQIPGKAYEYLRSGKPILALTDHQGATAELLREHVGVYIADMCSESEIAEQILKMHDQAGKPLNRQIAHYSRQATTKQLADLLDTLV